MSYDTIFNPTHSNDVHTNTNSLMIIFTREAIRFLIHLIILILEFQDSFLFPKLLISIQIIGTEIPLIKSCT